MTRKSNTFGQLSVNGIGTINTVKAVSAGILGLSLLALVVIVAGMLLSAGQAQLPSGTAAGLEASSARWTAIGEVFAQEKALAARDYGRIASVSAARYSALGDFYQGKIAAGVEASSARWAALGRSFAANYEAISDASSARWSALGDFYRGKVEAGLEASSARWSAMGKYYSVQGVQSQ